MGWIGIADHAGGKFITKGLADTDLSHGDAFDPHALLSRGTIQLETRLSFEGRPQTLLAFHRTHPWRGSFSLQALPGGGIVLVKSQCDDMYHATLPCQAQSRTDVIRITYSWDAPRKWGRLTFERPDSDLIHTTDICSPHPIPLMDLYKTLTDPRQRELGKDVVYFAVSSGIEAVGPMPGLTGVAPVLTPNGYVPADRLTRGDLACTGDGEAVPILHAISRTVPARGSFRPLRLRAPYFGLSQDIIVAPQQRLVFSGTQVEYLFAREAVLVPAYYLVNGVSVLYERPPDLVTYHQVLLSEHQAIQVADCPVESLYIGRFRRKKELVAMSVLAGKDRSRLPEHAKPVWPVLKPFEVATLAGGRAA